jgi:large subunit ribosomal protein L21
LNKRISAEIPPDGVNNKIEIMYAIVEIAGQQFKVEKDKKLFVHQLEAKEGDSVDFEKVLLVDNDGKVAVGTPTVKGAKVTVKVLEHVKGDKVLVFKKKRRKGYQKMNGHRQQFTQIQIETIVG